MSTLETTICSDCGAPVPVTTGYPDWCDRCGWNLQLPPVRETAGGRFARLAERLGRRSGERMARELLAAGRLEARWTPAKLAAFAVAGGVHLLSLALVAGGVAAIAVEFPNIVSFLIGAALVGTGVLMRPRLNRLDATHPPTALRIALLEGRPAMPPAVTLNQAWSARIDAELAPLELDVERELLDAHHGSLYYG